MESAVAVQVFGFFGGTVIGLLYPVFTLLAVHGMVAYWLKAIPYDHATLDEYLDSFVHYGAHTWRFDN